MSGLSEEQQLTLQQLRLLDWAERHTSSNETLSSDHAGEDTAVHISAPRMPSSWDLTRGLILAPWQMKARDAWFAAGNRGTIKVVTGAGKTVVALAIAEQLQRHDPELRMVVVVPTVVLMHQWHEALLERSNLPREMVGLLGGGHTDDFGEPRRVLVAVLSTARKILPNLVRKARVADHLFFVVDESHRVGAPAMSMVLNTPRSYTLGLSATPEREVDDSEAAQGMDIAQRLRAEIGEIVYEMSFAQAIRSGVLPPFEIDHFGLSLTAEEARRYQALTRTINDARKQLLAASPTARKTGGGDQLVAWARRVSSRSDTGFAGLAAKFINDTTRRKQLLYRAANRSAAALALIREAITKRPDARVILFHESIDEVVSLFELLTSEKLPVVMEHSELPADSRETSLDLFRKGIAQVIVSARSLIEGLNVPEADLGIIVASSSSPRQRIQSIGRVLRKYHDYAGEQKSSRVCVLYIRDSVDESIYERYNWDRFVGLDRNRYFAWDLPEKPIERPGPPRSAIPSETEINFTQLHPGDAYPGRYEGSEFSTDSFRNVTDAEGRVARNPQAIPKLVISLKGQPGRFKVTPRKRAILILIPDEDSGWRTLYGGALEEPFSFGWADEDIGIVDVTDLALGDPYPGQVEPAAQLRFRQRGGGAIAKRVPRGEVFARGVEAEQLASVLRELARVRPVPRILVNQLGHVLWLEDGVPHFITALGGELQFPGDV
jgi:superfamily II DNA or RNA helicase